MVVAVLVAFTLVVLTFGFHQRVMLWLGANVPSMRLAMEWKVLLIVVVLFSRRLHYE